MKTLFTLLLAASLCLPAHAEPETPADALRRTWRDTSGQSTAVLPAGDTRFVVLVFIRQDCPIANATLPVLLALHRELGDKGVRIIGVHCDDQLTAAGAKAHATEYGLTFPVILDPRHTLAAATGATVTPEAAVVDTAGKVVYLGRINNLYTETRKRRAAATSHDLAAALSALLAGKAPPSTRCKATGCYIKSH
jgi:peroxiredoxin